MALRNCLKIFLRSILSLKMSLLCQNCFQIARYYQKFCLQNVYFHFLKSFLEKFKLFLIQNPIFVHYLPPNSS